MPRASVKVAPPTSATLPELRPFYNPCSISTLQLDKNVHTIGVSASSSSRHTFCLELTRSSTPRENNITHSFRQQNIKKNSIRVSSTKSGTSLCFYDKKMEEARVTKRLISSTNRYSSFYGTRSLIIARKFGYHTGFTKSKEASHLTAS